MYLYKSRYESYLHMERYLKEIVIPNYFLTTSFIY